MNRRRGTTFLEIAVLLVVCPPATTAAQELNFERYREEVEPIFVAPRGGHGPGRSPCVTCHANNGTPLKLQPLQETERGEVFWSEAQSRQNFAVVSRLVIPGNPERSRLLRKALAVTAGGARFHVGGKFFQSTSDPEWQAMAEWVAAASPSVERPRPPALDFVFFEQCVQNIFLDKREGQMECVHCHNAGTRGFAQRLPEGREYWNREESRENFTLLRRYIEPGFPLRSRFLTHPLAPDAGGDHFHGGVRRWTSQDDREWQMLAAWVRGEAPECLNY